MKGIFDIRRDTHWNDDIVRRYHFPERYREEAEKCVGDWIVYRESRRGGGRNAYVAVARVVRIERAEATASTSFYAWVSDYLPFDVAVPLRHEGRYFEDILRNQSNPRLIGHTLQGKSIRTITGREFGAIVRAGLEETLDPSNAVRLGLDVEEAPDGIPDPSGAPPGEQDRRVVQMLSNRTVRDAAFRGAVLNAYGDRCAVTGLKMVNGGGRAEVQAAHILPVADGGPDIVQNGLALTATCHWLFDRHLISLSDDYGLLVSHNRVPGELRSLFSRQLERIRLPVREADWPRPEYVKRHRERFEAS